MNKKLGIFCYFAACLLAVLLGGLQIYTSKELDKANIALGESKAQAIVTQDRLNLMEDRLISAQNKVDELQMIYPPHFFKDYNELVAWMAELPSPYNDWDSKASVALQRQAIALRDGYIWNVTWDSGLTGYTEEVMVSGGTVYIVSGDGSLTLLGIVSGYVPPIETSR